MNKFEKQLEKWNNGVLRGAQAKLAKILNVSTATVAFWATGKRTPSKGYIAQMAQLFGLDFYDVMRLFQPVTTYPEGQAAKNTSTLRETQDPSFTYTADTNSSLTDSASNSVHIPLISTIGAAWPDYAEADICEWWTLPRAAAKGAKCLLKSQSIEQSPEATEDLFFIKPVSAFSEHTLMLLRVQNQYLLRRVYTQGESVCLCTAQGQLLQTLPAAEVTPLGEVVMKITRP